MSIAKSEQDNSQPMKKMQQNKSTSPKKESKKKHKEINQDNSDDFFADTLSNDQATAPPIEPMSNIAFPEEKLEQIVHENEHLKAIIQKLLTEPIDNPANSTINPTIYKIEEHSDNPTIVDKSTIPYSDSIIKLLRQIPPPSYHERNNTVAQNNEANDELGTSLFHAPVFIDHFDSSSIPITHVANVSNTPLQEDRADVVITTAVGNSDVREAIILDVKRSDFWVLVNEEDAEGADPSTVPPKPTSEEIEEMRKKEEEYEVIDKHEVEQLLSQYILDIVMHDPAARNIDPQQIRASLINSSSLPTQGAKPNSARIPKAISNSYSWGQWLYSFWGWATFSFALYRNPHLNRIVITWAYKAIKYAIVFIL